MLLLGNVDVVAVLFEADAQAGELGGDDAQVLERNVADRQLRTGHSCQTDEAADLDHVGQQRVFGAVQLPDTLDGEQVRGDARDACAHAVEH